MKEIAPLLTPDGRYIVVDGRLWRASNPGLDPSLRQELVDALMTARRAVRDASDFRTIQDARHTIDETKRMLGERGPVWWTDGSPDYNRRMVKSTPYAAWFAAISTGASDSLAPCPICLSTTDVHGAYSPHAAGDWPGCTNCEATAPREIWIQLVKARANADARGGGADTVTDNTTRFC